MPLDDPHLLKENNRQRLKGVIRSTFALGINVTESSTFKDNLLIITIILIIASWVDLYGHICFIQRYKNNVVIIAESICTMLQVVISIAKLSYIMFVQHRFYRILKIVETHELIEKIQFLSQITPFNENLRKESRQILNECWINAKRQFNFYMFACSSIIVYYMLNAQIVNIYNWYIGNTNHTNILPFPTLFPFWEDKMNQFTCYFVLTFVVSAGDYISGVCAISFDGIFIMIAMHGVALLRILKKSILFTTSPNVPKELRINYLRQCIVHYERTYRYCIEVNDLYSHMSLLQFIISLLNLGVVAFQASLGLESDTTILFRMTLFISAAGYEVIIYCLNGQLITSESESLPFSWYDCDWYNESREFRQLIYMMIMRSNKLIIMRASWFSTMSLQTLLAIVKTSSSYFLLLRNLAF